MFRSTFHFVKKAVRLLGLLLPQLTPGGPRLVLVTQLLLEQVTWTPPPAFIGDPASI